MGDKRVILLICDGLRADMVREEYCPEICSLKKRGSYFCAHHSVFPSVTRVASSCIATGCPPKLHGLHGNTMALPHEKGARIHDVGRPDFPGLMRQATGATLKRPALAQYFASCGGSVVMSNVSPGGAYFQDPDGYGFVYHRAGSYGPGCKPVPDHDQLKVSHDASGDWDMTNRFCEQVLMGKERGLGVLWLTDPDHTGHHAALGSPEHLEAIGSADRCAALVARTVERLIKRGQEVLCLVGSDHGQETVRRIIALDEELIRAGLKASPQSDDVLVAPQGNGALFYLRSGDRDRQDGLAAFLAEQDWAGEVFTGPELKQLGLPAEYGLSVALSMAKSTESNEFGVPGLSDYGAVRGKSCTPGIGQHGGLGAYEQSPFLIAWGPGFSEGRTVTRPSSLIDIAPSVLKFMGWDWRGMAGVPLQNDATAGLALAAGQP
jgi:hypothetical protein